MPLTVRLAVRDKNKRGRLKEMLRHHAVNLEDDRSLWLASFGPGLKEDLSPGYSAKGK